MGAADWNNEEFDAKIELIKNDQDARHLDLIMDAVEFFLGHDRLSQELAFKFEALSAEMKLEYIKGSDLARKEMPEMFGRYHVADHPIIPLALRVVFFERSGGKIGKATRQDLSSLGDREVVEKIEERFPLVTSARIFNALSVAFYVSKNEIDDFGDSHNPDDPNTPSPPSVA